MAIVQRMNVVLHVADDKDTIDRYMAKGFNVIDEKGKILKESMPNEIGALQAKVLELQAENEELKAQLAELTEDINSDVEGQLIVTDEPINTEEKPKRRGRKKQN